MRIAWIDLYGKIHEGEDHLEIAEKLFPQSDNSELSCEKSKYVKIGLSFNDKPFMLNYNPEEATQSQINSVEFLWKEHYSKNKKFKKNL